MRALAAAAVAICAASVAAGCGAGTGGLAVAGDRTHGKQLFQNHCASCHALADAGSTAKVGPNLDDAFAFARNRSTGVWHESTIRQVVRDQIKFAVPPMPQNLVTGSAADDVASYVASVAGQAPAVAAPSSAAPAPSPSTTAGTTTTTTHATTSTTTGGGGAAAGAAAKGRSLYSSLGCQACHTLDGTKSTGPTFKRLYGSKVKLTSGKTVVADMAYLVRAIVDPNADIVVGFAPNVMSAVIKPHQVSTADANALVAFIKTQR